MNKKQKRKALKQKNLQRKKDKARKRERLLKDPFFYTQKNDSKVKKHFIFENQTVYRVILAVSISTLFLLIPLSVIFVEDYYNGSLLHRFFCLCMLVLAILSIFIMVEPSLVFKRWAWQLKLKNTGYICVQPDAHTVKIIINGVSQDIDLTKVKYYYYEKRFQSARYTSRTSANLQIVMQNNKKYNIHHCVRDHSIVFDDKNINSIYEVAGAIAKALPDSFRRKTNERLLGHPNSVAVMSTLITILALACIFFVFLSEISSSKYLVAVIICVLAIIISIIILYKTRFLRMQRDGFYYENTTL